VINRVNTIKPLQENERAYIKKWVFKLIIVKDSIYYYSSFYSISERYFNDTFLKSITPFGRISGDVYPWYSG
ncbi:MAG TPA: hypothetical protein VMC84_10785, partial [Methanocella sp.]|uniref:hypothetical protein n=1 Tax=Methanocella sp. TaxID=2052833 RepID=UPI002B895AA1